jgi:hypothetical protein
MNVVCKTIINDLYKPDKFSHKGQNGPATVPACKIAFGVLLLASHIRDSFCE